MSTELNFGTWLKQRRSDLGLTQDELAGQLGFSPAMLRKLEAGDRRPSGQIASLLAAYFRLPADEREAFIAFARGSAHAPVTGVVTSSASSSIAPWRRLYVHHSNLPSALSPLIGREDEVQAARDLLLHPKTRLLTLTGTAGIGKTRLALQVASGLLEQFEDGTYFVDLSPVIDPNAVLPTLAHTLELKEEGGRSIERALLEYVRERRMFFVLDNFEQVLEAASSVVMLLQVSPWIKVLVTSREALHVRGERRFSVPPLGIPDRRKVLSLEALAQYPSVQLFIERAQEIEPDFALNQNNREDIAALCAGLEGLPLAIELAAAHANHLSAGEMRSALGSRLRLLTGGARDAPARHRTLRGAIEWSYNLLHEDEQRLFRHLGVFVGGFTLETLDALFVEQPGGHAGTTELLRSLADKHLVHAERQSSKPDEKQAVLRFKLLEAIREYATERMEQHRETEEIGRRHADYYLALADRAYQHFIGPQEPGWGAKQIAWIDKLEGELDNIRAALDWFQVGAEAESTKGTSTYESLQKGLRLATSLTRVWYGRGYFTEGVERLMALLAMVPKPLPGEPHRLRAIYAAALQIVGRLAPSRGGDSAWARPLLEESIKIATELHDKQLIARALLILGSLALSQGDYPAARSYQLDCLKLYKELGNDWGAAAALDDLGNIELDEGNLELARPLLEESLSLFRAVGEDFGAASVLGSLGLVAYYQKEYDAAHALWEDSLEMRRGVGDSRVCNSLILLGLAAAHQGDYHESKSLLEEGLIMARQMDSGFDIFRALAGYGVLESLQNNPEQAAPLFGAAEALLTERQIRLSPSRRADLDSEIAAASSQVPEEVWSKAWARGSDMSLEEVVAFALAYKITNERQVVRR
jgi:predicted ATPase/transcriptional regulator with XRE-family HTH domain